MPRSRRNTYIFLIRNSTAFLGVGLAVIALGITFFVTNDISLYVSILVTMVALLTVNLIAGSYEAAEDREAIQMV
jgi:hypothetical protein